LFEITLLNLVTFYKKTHVVNTDKYPLVARLVQGCQERMQANPPLKIFIPEKLNWKMKKKDRPRRNTKRRKTFS